MGDIFKTSDHGMKGFFYSASMCSQKFYLYFGAFVHQKSREI